MLALPCLRLLTKSHCKLLNGSRLQCLQEGLVPFDVKTQVVGDITIGIWFGSRNLGNRLHGPPSLSYCFHTAFLNLETETMRVSLPSFDIANKKLFPADKAANFFMDITLEDTDVPLTEK